MSFEANKLPEFEHKISDLPDQPNMQPNELKAYFDANPELLRQALGALCDALSDESAAGSLGFSPTAGVPADTVQDAVENVQAQLTDAVLGNIPSGSVTQDKLAQDVRDRFAAIESAATAEASARASGDSSLQTQINSHTSQLSTHTSQIAAKCRIYYGTYTGNGEASQFINLGFTPKAVLVFPRDALVTRIPFPVGALALQGHKAFNGQGNILEIATGGFCSYYLENSSGGSYLNLNNNNYFYIAFV